LRIPPKFENILIQISELYSLPKRLPNFSPHEPVLAVWWEWTATPFTKMNMKIKILMYLRMPLTFSPRTGRAGTLKSEGIFGKMRRVTVVSLLE